LLNHKAILLSCSDFANLSNLDKLAREQVRNIPSPKNDYSTRVFLSERKINVVKRILRWCGFCWAEIQTFVSSVGKAPGELSKNPVRLHQKSDE